MTTTLEIPDEAVGEVRAKFAGGETPGGAIPVMVSLRDSPDGTASAHFLAFMRLPAPKPAKPERDETLPRKRRKPDWVGLVKVDPGISSDWEDIKRSIEEAWAEEVCEKERRFLAEYGK